MIALSQNSEKPETDHPVQQPSRFHIAYYPDEHVTDDKSCTAGLCGEKEGYFANCFPHQCKCGKLVHADVNWSGMMDPFWGPEEKCVFAAGLLFMTDIRCPSITNLLKREFLILPNGTCTPKEVLLNLF